MEIVFFDSNIEKFIASLDKQSEAKTLRTINLLEEFGHKLTMPYSRCLDKGLFELRVRGKRHIRIIYCFHKNAVVLLHGFVKKDQKIPKRSILLAKRRKNNLENI